jgi:hypothetical protein
MIATGRRAGWVSADYSQYWVTGGPDINAGEETVPGLLLSLGPQGVAVLTGLEAGRVAVATRALPSPPAELDPGWEVVAETDLECPEGSIAISDWAGPDHPELGEMAISGAGRYRLRVHARGRERASERQLTEEHYLLAWPTEQPTPPRLLTPMDAHGRVILGEEDPDAPALDALDLAAAAAVRRLAELVGRPGALELSGELVEVNAQTIAPGTARKVWNMVARPWWWVGLGGGTDPANFEIYLHDEPSLDVRGRFLAAQPVTHLAYTWSWTTRPAPRSWTLPPRPTTVDIRMRRHGNGATEVSLSHRDLPAELADTAQPFWDWALRELHNRLAKAPFWGYPWNRQSGASEEETR